MLCQASLWLVKKYVYVFNDRIVGHTENSDTVTVGGVDVDNRIKY